MYCSKCGKQIADQSRFCSYCGAQVYGPQTTETRAQPRETHVQQPAPAKKSNGLLRWIVTVAVSAFVFVGVKNMTEGILDQKATNERLEQKKANQQSTQLFDHDSNFEEGFKEALTADPGVTDAMDSCLRGAIYQDGYVRYGMTKLYMPGYSLLPGEGDDRDWLISSDNALLFAAYRQLEIPEVSFDTSDETGMLNSYRQAYSDANMIDYQKYHVNGFPVIQYIVTYTADGVYQYQGELIVFPSETTGKTIRLALFADATSGYGKEDIDRIFDSLQVSPEHRLTATDADLIGLNRITVK